MMVYVNRFLKYLSPESLQGRFMMIIILPIISIQLIATYIFYERHWSNVSEHLIDAVGQEIVYLVHQFRYASENDISLEMMPRANLHLFQANFYPYLNLNQLPRDTHLEDELLPLLHLLQKDIHYPLSIHSDFPETDIKVYVELPKGLLVFHISRKRLYTPTTYIYVLWMMGTALVFIVIALLFTRNQVKSILRLAEAADQFGKRRVVKDVHVSGAKEVRQAFHAFVRMKNRIERYISQRTEMLAGVSHDLRTPLTRMKLQCEMLEHPASHGLKQDIKEMEQTIQGYLDFAKDEAEEDVALCSLHDLIQDVVDVYDKEHDVTVIGKVQSIVMVRTHAMKRAINNLISNALRYGNKVQIFLSEMNHQILISIEDNGEGIPEEQREAVFKPFFRVDASRNSETGGVGLGLAIVKDIITFHGGTIRIDNSLELGGARIEIRLPN